MGKISSIGFFIPAILAALVPLTIELSYKVPFLIALVLDILGLAVALLLIRPTVYERAAESDTVNYLDVVRQGFALRYFRVALFSGVVGAILFSVDIFRAPYQLLLSVPVIWFGIFFGVGRAIAALMLAYSGRLHRFIGDLHSFQRLQIIIYGVLLLVLGLVAHPWVVVVVFILDNALKHGLSQVSNGYKLDIVRDSKYKATLLSTGHQVENVFTMIGVTLMGITIEHWGYQSAFLLYGAVFFVTLIPLSLWIWHRPPVSYGAV